MKENNLILIATVHFFSHVEESNYTITNLEHNSPSLRFTNFYYDDTHTRYIIPVISFWFCNDFFDYNLLLGHTMCSSIFPWTNILSDERSYPYVCAIFRAFYTNYIHVHFAIIPTLMNVKVGNILLLVFGCVISAFRYFPQ